MVLEPLGEDCIDDDRDTDDEVIIVELSVERLDKD